eukprot:TRINITY_DN3782_c0_g1_i1.p1 TRINITY_DN3782_c0_g1~~TRINITY_DN3782_c0_g1_i1.p1  ORF type:complete len:1656 (-),score=450.40 TRINITY_DN3782_c0_g1_i1:84-5051(-)
MGDRGGRKKTTYSLGEYIGPDKNSSRGPGTEVCKFYAEGSFCRFGNSCRYVHAGASNKPSDSSSWRSDSRNSTPRIEVDPVINTEVVRTRGVVQGVKGDYGFIKRAGVSASSTNKTLIFYHNNDVNGDIDLREGDEVEFDLIYNARYKNGAEPCAANVKLLGSVSFLDTKKKKEEEEVAVNKEEKKETVSFMPAWMKNKSNANTPTTSANNTPRTETSPPKRDEKLFLPAWKKNKSLNPGSAAQTPTGSANNSPRVDVIPANKGEKPGFMPAWMKNKNTNAGSGVNSPSSSAYNTPRDNLGNQTPTGASGMKKSATFGGSGSPQLTSRGSSSNLNEGSFISGSTTPRRATALPQDPFVELRREQGEIKSMKDMFGFIKYHASDSLFFHIRDVEGGARLERGDKVEFYVIPDPKNPKEMIACNVRVSDNMTSSLLDGVGEQSGGKKEKFPTKQAMLQWISSIARDPMSILLRREDLIEIVNKPELPFTVIEPLILALSDEELLDSSRTDKIYAAVVESSFMSNPRNLKSYILRLTNSTDPAIDEVRGLKAVIEVIGELADRFRESSVLLPLDTLKVAVDKVEKFYPAEVADALKRIVQPRKSVIPKSTAGKADAEELDYRELPIFPTAEETSIDANQTRQTLPTNITVGKYNSAHDYLNTHFRLLREDCITSIRDGIKSFKNNKNVPGVQIYRNVKLRGLQTSNIGVIYRISFEIDANIAWERSKRLMYGSLLCLSHDGFKTLLWATVANRDLSLLVSKKQIDIRFPSGFEADFKLDRTYTMVESVSTYYEAYQHVLAAIQRLDPETLPFKDYIIHCKKEVAAPAYLKSGANDTYCLDNIFEDGERNFPILSKWPSLDQIKTSMDESQMNSLKQALTKEFAIVQGPPGTGKTFVGLKVMRALLDNSSLRTVTTKKPILVVCYTNHALDQFLEGVLRFEEKIVRIGSRSRSEALKDKNIRKLMYQSQNTSKEHQKARKLLIQKLRASQEQAAQCFEDLNKKELTKEEILNLYKPNEVMTWEQQMDDQIKGSEELVVSLYNNQPDSNLFVLESWLGCKLNEALFAKAGANTATNGSSNYVVRKFATSEDEENTVGEGVDELDDEMIEKMQMERMVGEEDDEKDNSRVLELDTSSFELEMPSESTFEATDAWSIRDRKERIKLYKYWVHRYRKYEVEAYLEEICADYEKLCSEKKVLDEELQVQVLNEAAVIGMTTTGVAKFQRLIHAVQPEIVIVEEAAEVLEAHIVTVLSAATKHVILIGDHQQLRPGTSEYTLAVKYHLDVSLFERMVLNGMEHMTLLRQRRMRPAISNLLVPIYPNLYNHPDVERYPNVKGVSSNLFFIDHQVEETQEDESLSKSNRHEATFVAKLASYLMMQGYEASQITVLTAYSGQVKLLRNEFRVLGINSIYITSVDNFQGEENDIIILSLVRSNSKGVIGFLNTSNRICVALSRAKIGMYITGNSQLLSKNKVWHQVFDRLKEAKSFGSDLVLQCQNHPEKMTRVNKDVDFKMVEDGGCDKVCPELLDCGHPCPRRCHPYSHSEIMCYQPCTVVHPCGHSCRRRCFEECGACDMPITRKLTKCGHTQQVPCYMPEEEFCCKAACENKFPCGHKCPKYCGEMCPRECHEYVQHLLPCGHHMTLECGQDLSVVKCSKPHPNK